MSTEVDVGTLIGTLLEFYHAVHELWDCQHELNQANGGGLRGEELLSYDQSLKQAMSSLLSADKKVHTCIGEKG